jgi:hypothetical protein
MQTIRIPKAALPHSRTKSKQPFTLISAPPTTTITLQTQSISTNLSVPKPSNVLNMASSFNYNYCGHINQNRLTMKLAFILKVKKIKN